MFFRCFAGWLKASWRLASHFALLIGQSSNFLHFAFSWTEINLRNWSIWNILFNRRNDPTALLLCASWCPIHLCSSLKVEQDRATCIQTSLRPAMQLQWAQTTSPVHSYTIQEFNRVSLHLWGYLTSYLHIIQVQIATPVQTYLPVITDAHPLVNWLYACKDLWALNCLMEM